MKLKIGIFFDGTGYNIYNSLNTNFNRLKAASEGRCYLAPAESSKQFQFIEQIKNHCHIPVNYFYSKSSSYQNSASNIWHLYNLYKKGETKEGYQLALYISGCGTIDGEDDDLFTLATGWSLSFSANPCGVIDKTDLALKLLDDQLNLLNSNSNFIFDNIEFELFGFSRGASSARHFANRIDKKDYVIIKLIHKYFDKTTYTNIDSKSCGKISFIGLYDSVAAILDLTDFDISSAKTGRVNIKLKKNIADNVFHITAAHEIRFNYSLNRTLPLNFAELELPGCHIDIGGGSRELTNECFFISKPFYNLHLPFENKFRTAAYKAAKKELKRLLSHARWADIFKIARTEIIFWEKNSIWPFKRFGCAVLMNRKKIKKGIDIVSLHAMINYAISKGCQFDNTQLEKFPIPADLTDLHQTASQAIQAFCPQKTFISLADSLPATIASKYIHCSFFWSSLPNKKKVKLTMKYLPNTAIFNLLLVNRPTDSLIRFEYDNFGGSFKQPTLNWRSLKNLFVSRLHKVAKLKK